MRTPKLILALVFAVLMIGPVFAPAEAQAKSSPSATSGSHPRTPRRR